MRHVLIMIKLALLLFSAVALAGCASGDGRAVSSEAPPTAGNTRVYSRERLERTGESSPADALPRVDPAITISRGGR